MAIHPTAIVDDGAVIGKDVVVGPFCVVGPNVRIGDGCRLKSHVVLSGRTDLGANCEVFSHVVLGEPPQHVAHNGEETRLVIGTHNIIREYVSMHCGTAAGGGVTQIGNNGFFMVGANIAHDCLIGDNAILANNATVGGHVTVGDHSFLGGVCAVHQYCRIGDFAFIAGGAIVVQDVIPYASAMGNHAKLSGLNIVGMKRRGMERALIHQMRNAYQILFNGEGMFADRVELVRRDFSDVAEVQSIVAFIDEKARRGLMMAEQ